MANMTSRVLALGTVAGIAALGIAANVFGTFSTTPIAGQKCSGYGYQGANGYGYDCTPIVVSGGGGGGGGGVISNPSVTPTNSGITVVPVTPGTGLLFPNFVSLCGNEVENLNDTRLDTYYNKYGVQNRFDDNRKLTRAEFLKLAINSAGISVAAEADPTGYSDVSASHTLKKYIAYATRNGIVSGYNGKFRPDDRISRAEAMKVIIKGTKLGLVTKTGTFADVPASNSLIAYIETAYANCIVHGRRTINGESIAANGLRYFEPADGISLAETVKVLYNTNK